MIPSFCNSLELLDQHFLVHPFDPPLQFSEPDRAMCGKELAYDDLRLRNRGVSSLRHPPYCCDWNAEETRSALAAAAKGAAIAKRDRLPEQFAKLGATPTHAQIIASNRQANAA